MKGKLMYCILAILIIGIISWASADTVSLDPIDDMYTDPNGTQVTSELWVANWPGCGGHFERIMLNFDLSELTGQTIDSSTLNLYKFFTAPDGSSTPTNFYAITQPWDEDTWNHTQHIQYNSTVWASQVFTSQLGWYEIDITNLVQAWVDGSITNYGLVIIANSGYKFSKFYSKEYSNQNMHPYLEVTYTVGAVDENVVILPTVNIENYPNPFNTETTISFNLPKSSNVKLIIYNSKGQIVKTLVDSYLNVGEHSIKFDASNLISGIYFYKIQTDDFSKIKKTILLK